MILYSNQFDMVYIYFALLRYIYIYVCRKLSGAGGSKTTKPSSLGRRIGGGVGVVVIHTKTVVSLHEASAIVFVITSARICTGGAPLVDLGVGRKYGRCEQN